MKKLLLLAAIAIGLLSSCPNSDSDNPNNPPINPNGKTLIVFDNTQGICAASVFKDYRRREEDKIAEIPAGGSSDEFEWTPGDSVPFYFSYNINLKNAGGFTIKYVPAEIGKDQKNVFIKSGIKTNVTIPKLEETVSSPDTPLSNKSYLMIQNYSSFPFRLEQGISILSPDNSPASLVNSGERVWYTITPGDVSPYRLLVGADYIAFPGSIANFRAGRLYSFVFDGSISLVAEIEIKLENVVPAPTPGLYRGAEKIGPQNLAASLAYISANAANGDDFSIVLGENEISPPNTLNYSGKSVGVAMIGYGGKRTVTLNANGSLFTVNSGVTLTLNENINLIGRSVNTNALVSVNGGKLIVNTGAKITGNTVSVSTYVAPGFSGGGGVYMSGGTFTMNGGEITGNTVSASGYNDCYGGGVNVNGGTFTMNGGEISGNTASGEGNNARSGGGGVFVYVIGTFNMNGGKITGNTAASVLSGVGGGVHTLGTFTMNDGEISGNTASGGGSGGGVDVLGIFTMNGGEITGNTASKFTNSEGGTGGGVEVYRGTFIMGGGKISGNTALWGGAVSVDQASFVMSDGEITGNAATNSGGGVYMGDKNCTFIMDGGEISGNTTNYGGGVFVCDDNANFDMSGGEIIGNTANYGGGVFVNSSVEKNVIIRGTFNMDGGKISNNTARDGGGVYDKGTFTMSRGEITGNKVSSSGGGVYMEDKSAFTMDGGEISGNTSSTFGGGVYMTGTNAIFTKTGGTITGYAGDTVNGNAVKNASGAVLNNRGHAVYVSSSPVKRRETTAEPEIDLDSSVSGSVGGWE